MPRYNAVFKGGGAKGIAYAGALEACEQAGVEFAAVAGSSAGAITATLIACGYDSGEMLAMMPDALAAIGSPARGALAVGRRSLLSSKGLRRWVAEAVADRARPGWDRSAPVPDVSFAELDGLSDVELFVVTMDLATRQPLVLCAALTPEMTVADAVVASSAIPVAFPAARLVIEDEVHRVVDGGTWANYPSFVFHDNDFRAFHDLPPTTLPTIGFVLDPPGTGDPVVDRRTRPAAGPSFPTDRGSSFDEFGALGALTGSSVLQLTGAFAPLVFVVLAVVSLVREQAAGYPFFSSLWRPFEDPALLVIGLLLGVAILMSLVAAFVGLRLGRELLDTGAVGATAAMGVGPSVPYWVRTTPGVKDHIVIRIEVPEALSTLTFAPPAPLVAEAVAAGRMAAQEALVTARLVDPGWSAPPTRQETELATNPALWSRVRGVGRWLGRRAVLVALLPLTLAWLVAGVLLIGDGSGPGLLWGVVMLAACAVAAASLGVRHASTRVGRTRRNRPFPVLDRVPQALLVVLGVAAGLGALFLGVVASAGPSAVAYQRAETVLARVAAVDDATGWAAIEVPDAENPALIINAALQGLDRPDLTFVDPNRAVIFRRDPPDGWSASCGGGSGHCLAMSTRGDVSVDATVLVLLDRQDDADVALGFNDDTPFALALTALVVVSAAALVAFVLRCLTVSTWRRSRQSLVAPPGGTVQPTHRSTASQSRPGRSS